MESTRKVVTVRSSTDEDFQLAQYLLRDTKQNPQIIYSTASAEGACPPCDTIIVCHRFSEQSPVPQIPHGVKPSRLIVLSDCNSEQTIIDTLESGAHHYFDITESPRILSVRLAAAMRNHQYNAIDVLEVFPFKFYVERRRVTRNDKPIHLSPREFALAYFLFSNYGRVVIDSELMVSIWTLPSSMDSRRIDTAICRIRKKMNLYGNASGWNLQRLRQVGYRLLYESEPSSSPNFLPDMSKCLLSAPPVAMVESIHEQPIRVPTSNTPCEIMASNSTISENSMPPALHRRLSTT